LLYAAGESGGSLVGVVAGTAVAAVIATVIIAVVAVIIVLRSAVVHFCFIISRYTLSSFLRLLYL